MNIGVLTACLASIVLLKVFELPMRFVFVVGVLPALLVLWIRRAVPEPAQWKSAKQGAAAKEPALWELFSPAVRRTTWVVILVCATSLSAHWAFMFWFQQHLRNLPDVAAWSESQRNALVGWSLAWVMVLSIAGNFFAGYLARLFGYRRAIAALCIAYFASMFLSYDVPHNHETMWWLLIGPGLSQGLFALFTMYLPPLFPTLLRTTGAGFCYNIGRIAAACGTVYFGGFGVAGDYRLALFYSGFLFLPAAALALLLPELVTQSASVAEPNPVIPSALQDNA